MNMRPTVRMLNKFTGSGLLRSGNSRVSESGGFIFYSPRRQSRRSYYERVGGKVQLTPTLVAVCCIPIITFALGTWQIQRLQWKLKLIEDMNDKLSRDPMELPKKVK
jgi:hypothetical protein